MGERKIMTKPQTMRDAVRGAFGTDESGKSLVTDKEQIKAAEFLEAAGIRPDNPDLRKHAIDYVVDGKINTGGQPAAPKVA